MTGPYFHGGVPGLRAGDVLVSAERLGYRFRYNVDNGTYDPTWVYFTTDMGVATGFANRFLDGSGRRPGDVYLVEPLDEPQPDADYPTFPEVFLRTRQARIVDAVVRGVDLAEDLVCRLESRYALWPAGEPIWDEDGLVNPSDQMIANGVTREWTKLLRPWLSIRDFDAHGRLVVASRDGDEWLAILTYVPSIDRRCRMRRVMIDEQPMLQCVTCRGVTADVETAVLHQLDVDAVRLLAQVHDWPVGGVVRELVAAARRRDPSRWNWVAG